MDSDVSDVKKFDGKEWSVVLNCGQPITLPDGTVLGNFQSGLYKNIEIKSNDLFVVEVGDRRGVTDEHADQIRDEWTPVYDLFPLRQFKGADFFRSPPTEMGDFSFSFWYSGDNFAGAIHNKHDFYELHTQILGVGEMQKFHEEDESTLYERVLMVPGQTHRPFFDTTGKYP